MVLRMEGQFHEHRFLFLFCYLFFYAQDTCHSFIYNNKLGEKQMYSHNELVKLQPKHSD